MRYLVLATDYDGTLARHGHVDEPVWRAIRRLRESGRKAVLVTGREIEDLQAICRHLELFDHVVAENGAVTYCPRTKDVRNLTAPPPPEFARALKELGVAPLSVGHVIVATAKPHEAEVLKTINEMGLELQVIFNQDAVMVLPSGVNKATGLIAALKELRYSPHNAVAIGDAENDHALLSACECGAAVGNAIPALKDRADLVMSGTEGVAVIELIDRLLADDLGSVGPRLHRHDILLGTNPGGGEERIAPHGQNILVAGTSGSGKSTLAAGLLERLNDARYQFAVIDPEGDYPALPDTVVLGSAERAPVIEEVLNVLSAGRNAIINLVGIPLADRPGVFDHLLHRLIELRGRTGRPHWIAVDETHHLMPASWSPGADRMPSRVHGVVMITVHPARVSRRMLDAVDLVLAVGHEPEKTIAEFCTVRQVVVPVVPPVVLGNGEALAYRVTSGAPPFKLTWALPRSERRRHRRKYAEGRLPDERAFVFRGPRGKLHLRAYNLMTFLELAAGVDDATWLHHLRAGEYSKWMREAIKDEELARDVEAVQAKHPKDAAASREAVRRAVEQRYTLPSGEPSGAR
jgi:hydroxymethylpyrimidine pyrophosphatase-like HAD family hydrolase